MSKQNIRIDLGGVDFASLHDDADYRREAKRLLPNALVQIGEATGEHAWRELQKGLRGIPGLKLDTSSSEKQQFIREAGVNYRKEASASDRLELEDCIVAQLKEHPAGIEGTAMARQFNDKECEVLRFLKQRYLTDGGRPQHLSGPGGATRAEVMQHCAVDEMQYREIMGRLEHFGIVQQIGKGVINEWLAIEDSIIEAVRSLDDEPASPQPHVIHNSVNIGTMNNSAIQQGSPGATQVVSISAEHRETVEEILAALAILMGKLPLSTPETTEIEAEVETIKAQLKTAKPKKSVIKECLGGVRSSLETIAGKAVGTGAAIATTALAEKVGLIQQITDLISQWGG